MLLTVLSLTLVSTCLAQLPDKNVMQQQRSPRAPQGQIQYSNPDGLKVDWKIYGSNKQMHSQSVEGRRSQRAETGTGQANYGPKDQVVQPAIEPQPHYLPYSAVPNHIKQLIGQAYAPQGPYVDPGAFFYKAPAISPVSSVSSQSDRDQPIMTQVSSGNEYYFDSGSNYRNSGNDQTARASVSRVGTVPRKIGGIKYKDDDRVRQRSVVLPYGSVLTTPSPMKRQYQPYKQIQESHSQFQRYDKQTSQPQQPQYQNHNRQFVQSQPQYQPQTKQIFHPQPQPRYQQFDKQNSRPQFHYEKMNKQPSQLQQYKQTAQSRTMKPVFQTNYDSNMPNAIQTLLKFQAQLPYNVIANNIHYRPKQIFIPKPLPESAKLNGNYPSKIYFLKTDGEIYDGPEINKNVKIEKRY